MAKVQGKKAATSVKKKAAAKAVASAKKSKKPAPKKAAAKPKPAAKKKPAPKTAAPKKPSAAKKAAPKKAAPAKKAAPKKAAPKPAPKVAAKPAPKPAKPAKAEKVVEPKAKPAPKVVAAPAPPKVADDKKRRRSRPRVTSNGPATAAWFSQGDKPRSSSFIPAPPRAEAPSLVAAPPASSDRLVGSHELTEFAVRTVPVRIDIEAGGGRIYLTINPNETTLKVGEGIEWDFRYLGGADVVIEEMIIEFAKPSPFTTTVFRSRRPGAARPHRQLSGPAQSTAAGKSVQYTVRAFNGFKTEMAAAKPMLVVT
jgi:adenylate kinase